MPRCTVILVTYNSQASIGACLEALVREECEIVVVDNASSDETLAEVRPFALAARIRLITNARNVGFGAAANQGAQAATGDVLLFLNPDAIADPGAIDALLQGMEASRADAAGGALLEADGQPDRGFAFRRLPTFAALVFEVTLVNRLWPGNPVNRRYRYLDADYSQPQSVEQPAGACLAVTREAWQKLGGFDERFYPVWFEDVDLCARLVRSGARIVYCPRARFRHSGAHSVGQLSFRDRQLFWYGNMLRYARKHFSGWQVLGLRVAIIKGMLLRSLAALFGARHIPLGEALRAYIAVVRQAL